MFATAVQISIITLQMYTLTVQKYTIAFAIVAKFNALSYSTAAYNNCLVKCSQLSSQPSLNLILIPIKTRIDNVFRQEAHQPPGTQPCWQFHRQGFTGDLTPHQKCENSISKSNSKNYNKVVWSGHLQPLLG